MLHRSELIPEQHNLTLKNPSNISDKSKQLSRSSVSSKCLTTQESMHNQIVQLKQKAHQSFMQVIQMQQLHEEEMEELRSEFTQKQNEYQLKIAELELKMHHTQELQLRIKQLQYENTALEKNYKQHNCELFQDDLSIDNIELITCKEESKLDDSAIINFTEIININKHEEQIKTIKEQIRKEVHELTRSQPTNYEDTNLFKMIEKIFEYVTFIKEEYLKLQEKGQERDRELFESTKEAQSSKFYETLQKETKFMTEHIKRLSAEKMKVQKKLLETEREFRILEEKMKRVESSLSKRGIKLEETTVKQPSPSGKPEQEQELELISQNFKSSMNPTHKSHYGLLKKSKN